MNKILRTIGWSLCIGVMMASCNDWTEEEIKDPAQLTQTNRTEAYYESLRAYKKTNHPIVFGWFGNWTGSGANLSGSLAGLPDSMDVVSIWGNFHSLSPEQISDMRYVQQKKGTKVTITGLLFDIGDKITPPIPDSLASKGMTWEQWRYRFWKWNPTSRDSMLKAIENYANAFCDTIDKYGYDGFDLDAEPFLPQPFQTNKELWNVKGGMDLFVQTMAKRLGPQSGTDRLLIIDGEPYAISPELGKCFNYFVLQTYGARNFDVLDKNTVKQVNHFKSSMPIDEIAAKIVVCEDYERYASTGGVPFTMPNGATTISTLGFAKWNPTINGKVYRKGGIGAYHIEYGHTVTTTINTYPFIRESIQIMNPFINK